MSSDSWVEVSSSKKNKKGPTPSSSSSTSDKNKRGSSSSSSDKNKNSNGKGNKYSNNRRNNSNSKSTSNNNSSNNNINSSIKDTAANSSNDNHVDSNSNSGSAIIKNDGNDNTDINGSNNTNDEINDNVDTVFNKMKISDNNTNSNDPEQSEDAMITQDGVKKDDYIPTLKEFCMTSRDVLRQYINNNSNNSNSNSRCVGLVNTGNTCYRNCILQVLLSLPPFYTILNNLIDIFVVSNLPDELKAWKQFLSFAIDYKSKKYKNGKLISSLSRDIPVLDPEQHLKDLFEIFKKKVHPNGVPTVTVTTNGKDKKNGNKNTKVISSQEDAHEFLTFLLDALDEEMNGISDEDEQKETVDEVPDDSRWETVNKPRVKEIVDDSSREDAVRKSASTLISRLFHGTLRSEVVYSNKKISSRFQIITQIEIELLELLEREQKPIMNNQQANKTKKNDELSINISDALKLYFAEEDLDNGARKRVKLENAPEILILHLKRFSFDYSRNIPIKINNDVNYDINITIPMESLSQDLMAKCINNNDQHKKSDEQIENSEDDSDDESDNDNDNEKNDNIQNVNGIRYKLIGLILHHGLHATGGHYTAITKETENSWKSMDDSTGSYISHGEALDGKRQVYLLFYEKI